MSIRRRIVAAALLRLYPAAWRSEYGPELADMLLARPLSARILGDVFWNGLRLRAIAAEPSTIAGLTVMLVVVHRLAWNIAAPLPYGTDWTTVLAPSAKTLPTVIVKPLTSELYVLFLVGCACWTHLRYGGPPSRSGTAAMRMSFIAGLPVMLAGILMLAGVLDVAVLGPGDTPTKYLEHGFTYTYHDAQRHLPHPVAVVASPLFTLPVSWIWGLVGGGIGRWIARSRAAATAAPTRAS
jgi:hypothetical protein